MHVIARDGVTYAPENYDTLRSDSVLYTYPGNRVDLFVQAPPADSGLRTFELRVRTLRPEPRSHKVRTHTLDTAQPNGLPLLRFRLSPSAAAYDTTLPAALPALPSFLHNIGVTRDTAVVVFNDTGFDERRPRPTPTQFYLGTVGNPFMRFNDTVIYIPISTKGRAIPMVLGESQTWRVRNYSVSTNHPFHIHTNPFQIVHVNYGPHDTFADHYKFLNEAAARGAPVWSDVVPLPVSWVDSSGATPVPHVGEVIIAQRYDHFGGCPDCGLASGNLVMHCHILGHEERGMMQLLRIFRTRQAAHHFVRTHQSLIANELGPARPRSPRRTSTTPRASSGSGSGSRAPGSGGGHGGGGGHHHGG
jgi:FtsP/CotA-like multicopper oxidase with cupredoxin domain